MKNLLKEFFEKVSENNIFHRNYLKNWEATDSEKRELNIILNFFVEVFHYSMDFIIEAYLFTNNMIMEETYYFIRNGRYRNSTFEEVNRLVYDNSDYMRKYMMGLSVSDYIWTGHLKLLRYFEENCGKFSGGGYLEIGPGFGQYLVKALLNCDFDRYYACDVSETSVDGSNKYLKYRELSDKCTVIKKDFFLFDSAEKFDCVVMGEVLEHVEQPLLMLRKIHEILSEGGKAFITTVINAPVVDHIYLFSNIEQVLTLVTDANFVIKDYICTTERNISIEAALKKKQIINIALILEK